jgi:hypothetical protein
MKIPTFRRSNFPVLLIAALGTLFTVVDRVPAQGWTPTGAPRQPWGTVASSADGVKLVAAGYHIGDPYDYGTGIYTSEDSGVTWTQTGTPVSFWSQVASSADGTKLVAVGGIAPPYVSVTARGLKMAVETA